MEAESLHVWGGLPVGEVCLPRGYSGQPWENMSCEDRPWRPWGHHASLCIGIWSAGWRLEGGLTQPWTTLREAGCVRRLCPGLMDKTSFSSKIWTTTFSARGQDDPVVTPWCYCTAKWSHGMFLHPPIQHYEGCCTQMIWLWLTKRKILQQDLWLTAHDQDESTAERNTPVPSGSTWASPFCAFRDGCSATLSGCTVQQITLVVGGKRPEGGGHQHRVAPWHSTHSTHADIGIRIRASLHSLIHIGRSSTRRWAASTKPSEPASLGRNFIQLSQKVCTRS